MQLAKLAPLLLLLPALLQAQSDRFGLPACSAPGTELADRSFFILCHDSARRVPLWVGYELTPNRLQRSASRPTHFRRDNQLTLPGATDADYRNSGLTRGHMAPSADFAWSDAAIRTTFLLSNAIPQYSNPNSGRWSQLEKAVRQIASTADAVYIFTGPIFAGEPQFIGPHRVAVPSHTFKAILALHGARKTMYAAIVPNTPQVTQPLETFLTSVEHLQHQTGLDLFPALEDAEEQYLESQITTIHR